MKLKFAKPYNAIEPEIVQNNEGNRKMVFNGEKSFVVNMTVFPATSQQVSEIYGERSVEMYGAITLNEQIQKGFGVCIGTTKPNFRVVSKKQFTKHFEMLLERI